MLRDLLRGTRCRSLPLTPWVNLTSACCCRSAAAAKAAWAFIDTDDLASADSALQRANYLREGNPAGTRLLTALRTDLAHGGAAAQAACLPERFEAVGVVGTTEFMARQRFKVQADCVLADSSRSHEHAAASFRLVDIDRVTLVGAADVTRLERALDIILRRVGMEYEHAHLDPAPTPGGPMIQVSLPGGTRPLWLTTTMDEVIGARVAAVVRNISIDVADGVVYLQAMPSSTVIEQIRKVNGVLAVRVRGAARA